MKNKEFKNKLILITYAIILFVSLLNYKWLGNMLTVLLNILLPFIIGGVIAFILNVIVSILEGSIYKKIKKGKRILSIISSILLVFGFIIILLFILIPQLKNAGMIFIDNIPEYQKTIQKIVQDLGLNGTSLEFLNLENNILKEEITNLIFENKYNIINMSWVFTNSLLSAITNFFVGFIFAIYILVDKEHLISQFKKILRKILNNKVYERLISICRLSNKVFQNFIKVQALEATILGLLCFIGMLLLRLPYAATISVLVGFTALIPVFGAFIGSIIGAFLIFMIDPLKAVVFIIFFLILQQIEGNLIYPHVVGGKIGLPSIWVLVAVMVGGSVGGIFGMLLGVPILSIIYSILKTFVNEPDKKAVKPAPKPSLPKENNDSKLEN